MGTDGQNRQARKTRMALLGAFQELVLKRRYDDIRVADIIRRADVGRSTFYEHFRDKDDLLRQSLGGLLSVLARAVEEGEELEHLPFVLDHFRENRRRALGLLNGPSAPQVVTVLASLIAERLRASGTPASQPLLLSIELTAAGLAEVLLGLLRAWLLQSTPGPAGTMALAIHRTGCAAARALRIPAEQTGTAS